MGNEHCENEKVHTTCKIENFETVIFIMKELEFTYCQHDFK